MHRWIFALAFAGGLLHGLARPAFGHDMYGGVYEYNSSDGPNRTLCCGGDPDTGDCEQLTWEQIEATPDGGVFITSKRYAGARVFVPKERAFMGIPMDMRRTPPEPAAQHDPYAGHWCGKPRAASAGVGSQEITPRQQDPVFITFCAFVKAGGV